MKKALLLSALTLASAATSRASIIISEVDPNGSSASTSYKEDWFELTNTGASDQDITGWKIDDNSQLFTSAVPLADVTTIPAGKSVVFVEDTNTTDTAVIGLFKTAWFGSNVPAGFLIGAYGGSGVGLSSTADGVNIFDSSGNQVTGVQFGATTLGATLDNAAGAGISGTAGNPAPTDPTISTASVADTNGAFLNAAGNETGSPGTIVTTPEPAGLAGLLGATMFVRTRRRGA